MERKFTEEEKEILEDCTSDLTHLEYFEDNGFFGETGHFNTTEDLKNIAYDIKYIAEEYLAISKKLTKILEKREKA